MFLVRYLAERYAAAKELRLRVLSALPVGLDTGAPDVHPGLAVSRTLKDKSWRVAVPRACSKWDLPEGDPKSYIVSQTPKTLSIPLRVEMVTIIA